MVVVCSGGGWMWWWWLIYYIYISGNEDGGARGRTVLERLISFFLLIRRLSFERNLIRSMC